MNLLQGQGQQVYTEMDVRRHTTRSGADRGQKTLTSHHPCLGSPLRSGAGEIPGRGFFGADLEFPQRGEAPSYAYSWGQLLFSWALSQLLCSALIGAVPGSLLHFSRMLRVPRQLLAVLFHQVGSLLGLLVPSPCPQAPEADRAEEIGARVPAGGEPGAWGNAG